MIGISAQVSLYPLRQEHVSPAIDEAIAILRRAELDVTVGPMSTVVAGDDDRVFDALKQAFRAASQRGDVVLVVTFSNACPV
ncbi:MAG TPA: YkoF family thiamine/hydroxymethylpyrimidine-binding protein [Dehalococcoidia bacterium]|nr:YkoF family thiamine/hydroxymethylpyrimidine-binding protein [Dehalococcoidia bacterium]